MSRYDGLIIPRSYSEYINKTDAATLQQALQLSGVLSGAVAAGDNKAVKSSAVATALDNQSSFIQSFRLDIVNNTASKKIILLGVMETPNNGRAGVNLDISYKRVDLVGRIFATLRAEEFACKYFCISGDYKPIGIKKTRIKENQKYNVYLVIDGYTPITRVIINAPLLFTVRGEEVTAIEGTEITCTAVGINDL